MSPSSARPVSTGYDNFSDLGVHSARSQRQHSYIRSSRRALTIAMQSEGDGQQTATSVERRSPCGQRYPQVRPRLVATPPYRATLAGCFWTSRAQTRRHGVQLPSRSSASVFRGIVPTSRRCNGNISDPLPNSSWSYRATSSAPMADGLSVWLVRRSEIPCRTACGIRLLAGTVSDNIWRRFCSQRTDAFSALEVSLRCVIDFFYLLTYLLTKSNHRYQHHYLRIILLVIITKASECESAVHATTDATHVMREKHLMWRGHYYQCACTCASSCRTSGGRTYGRTGSGTGVCRCGWAGESTSGGKPCRSAGTCTVCRHCAASGAEPGSSRDQKSCGTWHIRTVAGVARAPAANAPNTYKPLHSTVSPQEKQSQLLFSIASSQCNKTL